MPIWKRNLFVCWFGVFVASIGMSQIAPVLPLYIHQLGVTDTAKIEQYSGLAFGITFILSAVFSPIWGIAADKYGRKPMLLRASLGMAIVIFSMGFAQNVYELIGLRLLQGIITGYASACTALIATQTEKSHAGWALGTLSTAGIAGSLLGPSIGGFIELHVGMRNVFFITGLLLLIAFITTLLFVKENFVRVDKKAQKMKEIWSSIPEKNLTVTLFITYFALTFAMYSIEPVLTVYVTSLTSNTEHVALLAGFIFSASGLANIIAAPRLGRLSDKIGAHKVMLFALIVAGLLFAPQALVHQPWELMALRFLLGLAAGGLNPSVNILIKKITPDALTGRMFGLTMSAGYLGVFGGSVLGGQIAAWLGLRYVFLTTGAILLLNAMWVYFKAYKKLNARAAESR
ncbi:multidrug efflux MFS transporter [Paenibacillus glycanilyticus]|uniref:multidrug efflux MFS transporter n=1 Tax=Paenibacillus glycanilyticus TaxID=126569 RepID=UPI00203AD1A6|nr:multidrug efflux MFS transporter [Paenibacillus glycanilyticus]MCM3628530.1 multidrug efflux MFS transporter [Paenibacillus glycanilyticus]